MMLRNGRVGHERSENLKVFGGAKKNAGERRAFSNVSNAPRVAANTKKGIKLGKATRMKPKKEVKKEAKKEAVRMKVVTRQQEAHRKLVEVVDFAMDFDALEEDANMSLDDSEDLAELIFEGETKQEQSSLVDIDEFDVYDPQCVTEHVNEIYKFLRFKEDKFKLDSDYLSKIRTGVTPVMRRKLLNWLAEVGFKFRLLSDSVHMTVMLLDRFLSIQRISKKYLQLAGVAAMLVACKYEEIYTPEVDDFVFICDNAFSHDQVLQMERILLNKLNFDICHPTPLHFLRRFGKAAISNSKGHNLSKYLVELSMLEYKYLSFKPSLVAASAVYVARTMMDADFKWNSTMRHYTEYELEDIQECSAWINGLAKKAQESQKHNSVFRKYSTKFSQVALIPALESL